MDQIKDKETGRLLFLTQEERVAVTEFAALIRKQLGSMVKEIILFGSKVFGADDKESDIDILLVLSTLSWEIKKMISEQAAEENMKHNVIISTVRYDVATWNDPIIKASPFAKAVMRDGIWL